MFIRLAKTRYIKNLHGIITIINAVLVESIILIISIFEGNTIPIAINCNSNQIGSKCLRLHVYSAVQKIERVE